MDQKEKQKENRKQYNKQYYQANKEKIIKRSVERQRIYYKENPEYYNEYSRPKTNLNINIDKLLGLV